MDTSLLNIMYDDVFDGNYSVYNTYDNTSEFWTTNEETMQMQLTEALQGILPIPPTEDFHLEDSPSVNIQDARNSFKFENLSEHHLDDDGGAIKTASIDLHAYGYDTDGGDEANCDVADVVGDQEPYGNVFEQNDQQSVYSELTYGSQTDSSSIGDYESHSSDYDDIEDDDHDDDDSDQVDENDNSTNCVIDNNQNIQEIDHVVAGDPLPIPLIEGDPFALDNQSNTNCGSESPKLDVDGLDLNIDVQNFDLAEFITKEDDDFPLDYNLSPTTSSASVKIQGSLENVVRVIAPKPGDSDSDSDIIIDVEGLEPDERDDSNFKSTIQTVLPQTEYVDTIPDDDTPFVDNIKDDPSWTPTPISSVKKNNTTQHNKEVAVKKQMKSNGGQKSNSVSKKLPSNSSKGKTKPSAGKTQSTTTLNNKTAKDKRPLQDRGEALEQKETLKRITLPNIAESVSTKKQVTAVEVKKKLQPPPIQTETKAETKTEIIQPQKRKLNLEEYRKRLNERLNQKNSNNSTNNSKDVKIKEISQIDKNSNTKAINSTNRNYLKGSQSQATPTKRSEIVTSIVKCLKEKTNDSKAMVDPITEAKNKVLRMQELKKAQQLRIIDSTISAKIPKVTKVLPLREIVKDTPYLTNLEENKQINTTQIKSRPDYEEIIIVSASCNTDITIPPHKIQAENSLLKPYKLLSTISNTLQIVNTNENVKLSSNSLLSSIHGVVIKKSLPQLPSNETGTTSPLSLRTEHSEEHGEDKIIMHLRKDRIRKCTSTVGVQTDLQAAFPPLTLIKVHLERKPRKRERATTRKRSYRKRSESSNSSSTSQSSHDGGDNDRLAKSVETAAGLPHHSPEGSYSSVDYRRIYDGTIPNGGYSSRSTRRHRSSVSSSYSECVVNVTENRRQRRTSYKQRSKKRSLSPYTSSSSSSAGDCNRSCSRDYKRSRSRSRIRSRVRSRSRSNSHSSIRNRRRRVNQRKSNEHNRNSKVPTPAVEERRIVYVGRIEQETTKEKLMSKFSSYGSIKNISIHYKENGMKYGFVTFERSSDAFAAIDNGIHDPKINMYDVSFGGRREFCRATYADLDNAGINTYESYVYPKSNNQLSEEKDSFDSLLQKMKDKLNANKKSSSTDSKI